MKLEKLQSIVDEVLYCGVAIKTLLTFTETGSVILS